MLSSELGAYIRLKLIFSPHVAPPRRAGAMIRFWAATQPFRRRSSLCAYLSAVSSHVQLAKEGRRPPMVTLHVHILVLGR